MALSNPASGNSRIRLGQNRAHRSENHATKPSGSLDRKFFEFDRKIVSGVLDTLQGAIGEGATQMEMVADEHMFDPGLSGTFSRTAQHLDRMARRLAKILGDVASATGYPKIAMDHQVARAAAPRLPVR
jgi:hypothetical protein